MSADVSRPPRGAIFPHLLYYFYFSSRFVEEFPSPVFILLLESSLPLTAPSRPLP